VGRWSIQAGRLVGSTEKFGAAFFDVLSVVWSPRVGAGERLSNLDPKQNAACVSQPA
jgi:hypothetical protein